MSIQELSTDQEDPLLEPAGACRQCLVDIEINGRAFPKPQASCTIPVENGMIVKTQLTSAVADKAQKGVMELLLINHPLDCPVCDKGGECPLQNQAMSTGRSESRCEHCASGCDMRTDVRRGKTLRRLAGDDADVNEEWNCDKGRWAFKYEVAKNRLTAPMIRDSSGQLQEVSWPEALAAAAAGLRDAKAGVLVGGRRNN